MTSEQIAKLAVESGLVAEVYDILHSIIIADLRDSKNRVSEANSKLNLIKKFADANKLKVIKDIFAESEE